jgi:hypothetical protein
VDLCTSSGDLGKAPTLPGPLEWANLNQTTKNKLPVVPLLAGHGTFPGSEWRSQPPDVEICCEYTEYSVADSRQDVILQLGSLALR